MTQYASSTLNLIASLVTGNHILYDHGVVDAFGHISVRHDLRNDRFFLAKNKAPGAVEASDILEFGLDGEPVEPTDERIYLERFLHSEIYRIRPDVQSIVHSHSHNIVPFSVLKSVRLKPMFHMAGFLRESAPIFEIREKFGDGTDLLIRDQDRGKALAELFVGTDIVLMRGHGSTVVADSIERAVFRAVYAEINAQMQKSAGTLDDVIYLTAAEAMACMTTNEGQVARPWALWATASKARRHAIDLSE